MPANQSLPIIPSELGQTIGQENLALGKFDVQIDPASNIVATTSVAGLKLMSAASAVTITDNATGLVTIAAGVGNTQDAIRPIQEQSVAGTLTAADKFTVLNNGGSDHQSITLVELRRRLQTEIATAQVVVNAPGGVIPQTQTVEGVATPIDTYTDFNGSHSPIVTLPVPVHNGQRLIFNHLAILDATVATANSSMTAPLLVNAASGGAEWVAVNGKWHLVTPSAASSPQDFFRSTAGLNQPNAVNDYTEAITHNGFLGLGLTADPVSPLEFGDSLRNDIIRLWDGGANNPHQFYGLGVNANQFRMQVPSQGGRFEMFGGDSATASRMYSSFQAGQTILGDPTAVIGEPYFRFLRTGDDSTFAFMAPNAAVGANKIQAQISYDGFSGNGGVIGACFDIQTAATTGPNTVLQSRILVNGVGQVMISAPGAGYTPSTGANALLTVNGSIRVKGGAIVPGNTNQVGGIIFGAGPGGGGIDGSTDADGGMTSTGDDNLTFYTNGVLRMVIGGGNVSKPGGGPFAATSDIRTKKFVTPHISHYAETLALEPIEYSYNGEGGTVDDGVTRVGFSAQDVQKLFPRWVSETKESIDGSPVLSIDSSNLIYELLHVVKLQADLIDSLNDRVAALEVPKKTTRK